MCTLVESTLETSGENGDGGNKTVNGNKAFLHAKGALTTSNIKEMILRAGEAWAADALSLADIEKPFAKHH